MTLFVGIDSGVHAAGVALCDEDGELLGAEWARADGVRGARAAHVAEAVVLALRELGSRGVPPERQRDRIVVGVEFPEVTRGRARGAARTEDLLELAFAVGTIEATLHHVFRPVGARALVHTLRVRVRAWKANVSTDALAARLALPPPAGLTPHERSTIIWPAPSYRHNVVDAVCLARWLAAWPARNPAKNLADFSVL